MKAGSASWSNQSERSEKGDVAIVTVADLVALAGPDAALFIVKLDIEGFESDVFSGNCDWVGDPRSVWDGGPAMIAVEPHDWMLPGQGTSASFQAALFAKGFEVLIRGENLFFVRPQSTVLSSVSAA
jgi:hypothetical protein